MLAKMSQKFGAVKWNLWPDVVDDDEPVLVACWVEAAENLSPLAEQIGADDAFVKGATLRIAGSVGLVKGVRVNDHDRLNAAVAVGDSLDFEGPVVRGMNAKAMLSPAWDGKH